MTGVPGQFLCCVQQFILFNGHQYGELLSVIACPEEHNSHPIQIVDKMGDALPNIWSQFRYRNLRAWFNRWNNVPSLRLDPTPRWRESQQPGEAVPNRDRQNQSRSNANQYLLDQGNHSQAVKGAVFRTNAAAAVPM